MENAQSNATTILSLKDFLDYCVHHNLLTGIIAHESIAGNAPGSNALSAIKAQVYRNAGYAYHEAICFRVDPECACVFFAFIHSTVRGMAQGGTRMMAYATLDDLLFDGLRLSRAMTEKNSVAEIWWGGGKSIICPINGLPGKNDESRKLIFQRFGAFIASLNGAYVAAEDMNTTPEDMQTILSVNRFVTCLPRAVGGSSNPSPWTAKGVFYAMKAAIAHEEKQQSLKGKTVLIQGVGNVGLTLAKLCAADGATIIASDPNEAALETLRSFVPEARSVSAAEVYNTPCDIFAPSARGGVINDEVVEKLSCRYVIGAANNQLVDDVRHSDALHRKGIVYLPDFFVNRMGIVNCANEQYGYLEDDLHAAVEKIYTDTIALLDEASGKGESPYAIAIAKAKKLAQVPHPIWGHRGKRILEQLIAH